MVLARFNGKIVNAGDRDESVQKAMARPPTPIPASAPPSASVRHPMAAALLEARPAGAALSPSPRE